MVRKPIGSARFRYFLVEHLEADGVSNAELARRLGLTPATITKWIQKGCQLTPRQAQAVGDALEKHPNELLLPPGAPSIDAMIEGWTIDRRLWLAGIAKTLPK